jgi:hypothetical protein
MQDIYDYLFLRYIWDVIKDKTYYELLDKFRVKIEEAHKAKVINNKDYIELRYNDYDRNPMRVYVSHIYPEFTQGTKKESNVLD